MSKKRGVFWRLVLPSRLDAVISVAAALLVIGHVYCLLGAIIFVPESVKLLFMAPVTFVLIALGCSLGWNRFGLKRLLLLVLVCLVCPFLAKLVTWIFGWQLIDPTTLEHGWVRVGGRVYSSGQYIDTDWYFLLTIGLVGILLATWILVLLLRMVPRWLMRASKRLHAKISGKSKITRSRVLIGIAVALFSIQMLDNVLTANGMIVFGGRGRSPSAAIDIAVGAITGLMVFAVVFFWPSWGILRSDNRWSKYWAIGSMVSLICCFWATRWFTGGAHFPLWTEISILFVCCLMFVLTLFCVKKVDQAIFPSFWSFVPLVLTGVVLTSSAFVDYSIIMDSRLRISMADRIVWSLESGQLAQRSSGQLRGYLGNYVCNFDASSQPDLLGMLDLSYPALNLTINNMQPHVESDILGAISKSGVSLIGGTVSAAQFEDIAFAASHVKVVNVKFDSSQSQIAVSGMTIYASFDQSENLNRFLNSIKEVKSKSEIQISSNICAENLPALANMNKNCELSLLGDYFVDDVDWSEFKDSFGNVVISSSSNSFDSEVTPQRLRFLLGTEAQISCGYCTKPQVVWDLIFACPGRVLSNSCALSLVSSDEPNRDVYEDFHLAWGRDGNGAATHLFLPGVEAVENNSAGLRGIKVLSFDWTWFDETASFLGPTIRSLDFLFDLKELEELYLTNSPIVIPDVDFLRPLKKLKHLQIPNLDRSAPGTVGFDSCPSLESITFLGKPDTKTIQELAKLPRLKKVTISDVNNSGLNVENGQIILEQKLPGVEIEIMPFGKHKLQYPESFRKHREATQKKVLKKLRKQAGLE